MKRRKSNKIDGTQTIAGIGVMHLVSATQAAYWFSRDLVKDVFSLLFFDAIKKRDLFAWLASPH